MAETAGKLSSDPRARLAALADGQGVSLAALSRLIGRNGTYLQQFITKGSPRKLAEADRKVLAEFFGVDEGDLGGVEEKSYRHTRPMSDIVSIPRLSLAASAGQGAFGAAEVPLGAFQFTRGWLRAQGLNPAMISVISVAGDSMEPELRDGDEILVDRTPRPLRDGIHVVRLGDMLHVKRVQAGSPGMVRLISANPAYPPIEAALADLDVIGRVVWKGGRI